MSWFKRIFKKNPEIVPKDDVRQVSEPAFTPLPRPASEQEAQTYLQRTREKIQELAHRFADGGLNRKQFEDLYTYYQNEIQRLEFFINENPLAEDWKNVISEGQSVMIRRKSAARLVGYSIYENHSGMPLRTAGDFGVDPALFVPMLYAYANRRWKMAVFYSWKIYNDAGVVFTGTGRKTANYHGRTAKTL
jgi:hypothetical protein